MKGMPRTVIVLAAGGTGGHMFPAEALARELAARRFALALVTDRRGAAFGDTTGVEVHRIHAAQVAGNIFRKIAAAAQLARGLFESRRVLRELEPAAVVGFGGYASFPVILAAILGHVPALIHEQNAVLGRANRLLASRVDAIATSFDQVQRLPASGRAHLRRTGNPVRPAIAALSRTPYPAPAPDGPLNVLVTGGSQGAAAFSTIVPAAVAKLAPEFRARLRIAQQCKAEDIEAVTQAYHELSVAAELRPFFADMPEQLARAQLVIARAGASTVAEIMAAGRPSILIPFPAAMDDHQSANAVALFRYKCAWPLKQNESTAEKLKEFLQAMLADPTKLTEAARRARDAGIPDAAARLADVVMELISNGGSSTLSRGAVPREAAE